MHSRFRIAQPERFGPILRAWSRLAGHPLEPPRGSGSSPCAAAPNRRTALNAPPGPRGHHTATTTSRHAPQPDGQPSVLHRTPGVAEDSYATPGGGVRPAEQVALWTVGLFSAAALLGFGTFGVNPELLGRFPSTAGFFALSFRLFSIGQILIAAGCLVLLLVLRVRLEWVGAFVAIYVISLSSELSGVAFGFPFGPYYYTPILGARWFDLVPLVIPLSWFMMAIPSYYIAAVAVPEGGAASRIVLGALLLTAWDVALDPAMSYATVYWRWEVDGSYYGMPLVNLAGWLFTSALLMSALVLLRSESWIRKLPLRWIAAFYSINLILPLGMAGAAGLGWAVIATVVAYLALAALALVWRRKNATEVRAV
jgi:uncharacterized membrane protein